MKTKSIKEHIESLAEARDARLQSFDKEKSKVWSEYVQSVKTIQDLCTHENTREEEDFDYHKRETWIKVFCKDCGKLLDRY